ncbi:WYL domain-containing protein [bacterium]|nr:WYL domain-containing protein [bacterium]
MTETKPRYSRVSDIIELATFMASRPQGITINDIIEKYNVSRRTAERMRDSLLNIFPQIIELDEIEDSHKHWGFVDYSIKELINFDSKEIANLCLLQNRTTNKELKEELGKTIDKIKTLQVKKQTSIQNNIEMIMQTEGYALRQMPQYKIDDEIIIKIRESLKNSFKIKCQYHEKNRVLEPLGMIYGEKIYLLAKEPKKGNDIYTYLLHKIEKPKLTKEKFDRGDFDLKEYSKRSFGVYFGEILNVKLQFDKEIAQDVLSYNFHPTQKSQLQDDGTVIVKFKASGDKEIMWHVFKWGNKVKILAPKTLQSDYKKLLKSVLEKNNRI